MEFTLQREPFTDLGTQGTLTTTDGDGFTCKTIERQNDDNNPVTHACILAGKYTVKRSPPGTHPKHPGSFQIMDVKNRTDILIHVANTMDDLLGCVGLGQKWGTLVGTNPDHPEHVGVTLKAVLGSKQAYKDFMEFLDGVDEFTLTIIDAPNTDS